MLQVGRWMTSIAMLAASMIPTPCVAEEPKPIDQEQQSQNVASRFMEGQLPNWHYGGFVDLGIRSTLIFLKITSFAIGVRRQGSMSSISIWVVCTSERMPRRFALGHGTHGPRWPRCPQLRVWNKFAPRGGIGCLAALRPSEPVVSRAGWQWPDFSSWPFQQFHRL